MTYFAHRAEERPPSLTVEGWEEHLHFARALRPHNIRLVKYDAQFLADVLRGHFLFRVLSLVVDVELSPQKVRAQLSKGALLLLLELLRLCRDEVVGGLVVCSLLSGQ